MVEKEKKLPNTIQYNTIHKLLRYNTLTQHSSSQLTVFVTFDNSTLVSKDKKKYHKKKKKKSKDQKYFPNLLTAATNSEIQIIINLLLFSLRVVKATLH